MSGDAVADAAAQAVNARAFAVGEDIFFFFARGAFDPSAGMGREILAHELVHVTQHHRGQITGMGSGATISKPSDPLEREAEAVSQRALQTPSRPAARTQEIGAYFSPH